MYTLPCELSLRRRQSPEGRVGMATILSELAKKTELTLRLNVHKDGQSLD